MLWTLLFCYLLLFFTVWLSLCRKKFFFYPSFNVFPWFFTLSLPFFYSLKFFPPALNFFPQPCIFFPIHNILHLIPHLIPDESSRAYERSFFKSSQRILTRPSWIPQESSRASHESSQVLTSSHPCIPASPHPCVRASPRPCIRASAHGRIRASVHPRIGESASLHSWFFSPLHCHEPSWRKESVNISLAAALMLLDHAMPCPDHLPYFPSFLPPTYLIYPTYLNNPTYLTLIPFFNNYLKLHAPRSYILMSTPNLPYPLTDLTLDE